MKTWQLFMVALILLIGCGAAASESKFVEEQIVETVECSLGHGASQDVRRLEVHTKEAGCVLFYFKYGKNQKIANARRGVDVCKGELKKVRKTLEGSGYQCK